MSCYFCTNKFVLFTYITDSICHCAAKKPHLGEILPFCCIVDYQLKEEILRKAHTLAPLLHHGKELRLFQDLSSITLQRRRELKPLLEVLRSKGIVYCWKFTFDLVASIQGRSALLRVPEDLHNFCKTLDIPLTEVSDWYAQFRPSLAPTPQSKIEPMETQDVCYRRHRSPSEARTQQHGPQSPSINSLKKPSQTCRARRDR